MSGRRRAEVFESRACLSQVLLHKLRAVDADEGGGGVVRNRLGQHRLASAGRAIQQHATGWVDANLPVQLVVRQRKLHRFADLLLLDVGAANVLRAACASGRVSARPPAERPSF